MFRRALPLLSLFAVACGPTMVVVDAGIDAGEQYIDAGPPRCQQTYRQCAVDFSFRALDEQSVQLRGSFAPDGWVVGVPMQKVGDEWRARITAPYGSDIEYKFRINNALWVTDPANPPAVADGNSIRKNVSCSEFTCPADAPEEGAFDWRDAVMAFVFVDRFFDGDATNNCTVPGATPAGQYQGGDWKGVQQKLEAGYFSDLGINTLWLTVPVKNATVGGSGGDGRIYSAYHGYWPIDLEQVESCFGSKEDLIALVDAAHARGMQVLFDFAMVHVHSSSALYAQHPEWFWSLDFNGGQCVCDDGSVCPWNAQGQRCWFTSYLPHWNYTVAAAREYSVAQAAKLLAETGADGFRLDAIKHVDTSWLLEVRQRVEAIAATRSPRPRIYLVGETFDFGNREYLKSFVDPATRLDGQFDFPLRLQLLESVVTRRQPMTALRDFVLSNDSFYGPNALMSPWIGNHDLGRVIHMAEDSPLWGDPYNDGKNHAFDQPPLGLPGSRRPFERMANAFVFLLTSPGVPLLYYGDEIGLPGGGDPDNRRFMQWSGLNGDQTFLRGRFAMAAKLRAEHAALRRGKRTVISATADTFVYSMSDGLETVYVAINRGDTEQSVQLPSGALRDLYNQESLLGPTVRLPARSSRILTQ